MPPAQPPPAVADAEPEVLPAHEPLFTRRQIAIAVGAGVATAAITLGLVTAFGGSSPKPRSHSRTHAAARKGNPQGSGGKGLTTPTQPAQNCQQGQAGCTTGTIVSPPVSGPTANWMGMQIVTSPSGVVVDTVQPGSTADLAGFEPGDQIMSVDTHVIGNVYALRSYTAHVKLGAPVTIAILRSSLSLTLTSIPLTQRPTIHP